MADNAAGEVRKNVIPMLQLSPEGHRGSGAAMWAGVSTRFRTGLHIVDGTKMSQYCLNNIIDPIIMPLQTQLRPELIFMHDIAPAYHACVIIACLSEA